MQTIILLLAAFLTAGEAAESTNTKATEAVAESATGAKSITNTKNAPEQPSDDGKSRQTPLVFRVSENSPAGTVVGIIPPQQSQKPGQSIFVITGGNEAGTFTIDSTTGRMTVAADAELDYERKKRFSLKVAVVGPTRIAENLEEAFAEELLRSGIDVRKTMIGQQSTDDQTITIDLTDLNEPPQMIGKAWSLAENTPKGTLIGRVQASDADAGERLTYEIIGETSGETFAVDANTGDVTVHSNALLDYEESREWLLKIEVTDSHAASRTADYHITLTDVDEPPLVSDQSFRLPRQVRRGTILGKFSAIDPDADDELSFAVTGGDPDRAFRIDPKTGEIALVDSAKLKSWPKGAASLEITVTDRAGAKSIARANLDFRAALAASRRARTTPTQTGARAKPQRTNHSDNGPKTAKTKKSVAHPVSETQQGFFTKYAGWAVAAVMGIFMVVTTLQTRQNKTRRRKSLKALERERDQIRDSQQELDNYRNELRAEKNELIAVQRLLTHEFEKLHVLLGRHQAELDSTETTIHESVELLQSRCAGESGNGTQTIAVDLQQERLTESLKPLWQGLGMQKDRLGALQKILQRRDRELETTCANMEVRLEEALQRLVAVEASPETNVTAGDSQARDISDIEQDSDASTREWNSGQKSEDYEDDNDDDDNDDNNDDNDNDDNDDDLEQQWDSPGTYHAVSSQYSEVTAGNSWGQANAILETVPDIDAAIQQLSQKSVRMEMDTLREVANQSARTAFAQHSRKQMWQTKLVLGVLTVASFFTAIALLSDRFWSSPATQACGWGAAAIGAISITHLLQKLLSR